jgi:hypothetical protein
MISTLSTAGVLSSYQAQPVPLHWAAPTSASWMDVVEILFSILTKQHVRRGAYRDVPELKIEQFIRGYNERAPPFVSAGL